MTGALGKGAQQEQATWQFIQLPKHPLAKDGSRKMVKNAGFQNSRHSKSRQRTVFTGGTYKERTTENTVGAGIVYFHLFQWKPNENDLSTKSVLRGGQGGVRSFLSPSNRGIFHWRGWGEFVELGGSHFEFPGQLTDGKGPTAVHSQPVLTQCALQGEPLSRVLVRSHRLIHYPGTATPLPGGTSHVQLPKSTNAPKSARRDVHSSTGSPKSQVAQRLISPCNSKTCSPGFWSRLHTWNHCFL